MKSAPANEHDRQKEEENIQTPYFRTYSRRMLFDLSQTLHGDIELVGTIKKGWLRSFFDPTHSFSYMVLGKIRPN